MQALKGLLVFLMPPFQFCVSFGQCMTTLASFSFAHLIEEAEPSPTKGLIHEDCRLFERVLIGGGNRVEMINPQTGCRRHGFFLALDLLLKRRIDVIGENPLQRRQGLLIQVAPFEY